MLKKLLETDRPVLKSNAPIFLDLFSAGGGVKVGGIMAGFRPIASVEKDPKNIKLSESFKRVQEANFNGYGNKFYLKTVQEMAATGWAGLPKFATWLHASPVCANFSGYAGINSASESPSDITAAIGTSSAIESLKPKYFTLEQVPRYEASESFKTITQTLRSANYVFFLKKVNFGDWGVVAQDRERLFLVAWKNGLRPLKLPPVLPRFGWAECLQGLALPEDPDPLEWQKRAVEELLETEYVDALLIEKVGKMKAAPKVRKGNEPIWTITKAVWHDQKHSSRYVPFSIWLNDFWYAPSARFAARLAGFPDWVILPDLAVEYGSMLGYSVPPTWIYHFLSTNFKN